MQAGRGMALEGLGRHSEANAAFREAFARAGAAPSPARARLCWAYGFAVADRLPDRAREAFDEVLRHDPRQPQALYGRAMIAMRGGRSAEALGFFDRALEADPGFLDARRYRAVLLARRGEWTGAARDINQCLEREPRGPATLYAAACVSALAAGAHSDRPAADRAIDLLAMASANGGEIGEAAGDPDLAGLRDLPRFRQLLASVDPKARGEGAEDPRSSPPAPPSDTQTAPGDGAP